MNWHGPSFIPADFLNKPRNSRPVSERVRCDDYLNRVVIDGYPVCAEVLDAFTTVTPPGQWFRIVSTKDGSITVQAKRSYDALDT